MLTRLPVIISQYMQIWSHRVMHLKLPCQDRALLVGGRVRSALRSRPPGADALVSVACFGAQHGGRVLAGPVFPACGRPPCL